MRRTPRGLLHVYWALLGAVLGTCGVACELQEPWGERVESILELHEDLGPPMRVFAKRFVAPIYQVPAPDAPRLGYLRAGAVLQSTTTLPVGREGCDGGWFELDTGGFVCAGRDVTIFSGTRLPERRARQPDRDGVMPYEFATVRRRTPLYRRIPGPDQVVQVPAERPEGGEPDGRWADHAIVARILEPGFYVSLDRAFEREWGTYWRTQQNGFLPDVVLRRKPFSEFQGQVLGTDGYTLPVAVTRDTETTVYRTGRRGSARSTRERLSPRSWLRVEGRRQLGDHAYLEVGDDRWVREADVRVLQPRPAPPEVGPDDRWIDVDLANQSLVAYEGSTPRFVTLVSTGRLKTPSPDIDYRTPRGLFRIRTKHLTATMDNDEPGEPPYSLEDVPYVMYFHGAYAFHSAFWHDRFGHPRSHGCINLAPADAKWLYNWAGPDMPGTWHGGFATDQNLGTWVFVHGRTP